jgi:hypothetical protein
MAARRRVKSELEKYDDEINEICDRVEAGKIGLRKAAKLALSAASALPHEDWNFLSVVGKLWVGYEARFKREWIATPAMQWENYKGVQMVVAEFGIVDAVEAIDVLYVKDMKWVDSPVKAYINKGFFIKCLIPKLLVARESKSSGEQVEAIGGRDGHSSMEVSI